jgi:hypothetical protein
MIQDFQPEYRYFPFLIPAPDPGVKKHWIQGPDPQLFVLGAFYRN